MPRGHTTKKTMTHFRATLLGLLPTPVKDLNHPWRKQLNEMCGYGWADVRDGVAYRTQIGNALLNEANARDGFAQRY